MDADAGIGSGHLFRCFALARLLRANGIDSVFVSAISIAELRDLVTADGFALAVVEAGLPATDDADATAATLMAGDVVVVDRPGLDEGWERVVRPHASRLIAIDDRPGRRHFVDALVSTAAFADDGDPFQDYLAEGTPTLVGPTFMPLREEFERLDEPRERTHVTHIGAFFGGNDPGDQIERVIDVASRSRWADTGFHIVCGVLNTRFEQWKQASGQLPNVEVSRTSPDMASFWAGVDVGIGSYGMSAWERCAVGLPTISTVQTDDQLEDAIVLERAGAVIDLGRSAMLTSDALDAALTSLAQDSERLKAMSRAAADVMRSRTADRTKLLDLILGRNHVG